MRKVIFSLAVIVFIVVVLIFVLPYVMGATLKSQIYNLAKADNLPGGAKVEVENYHVGWLTSRMDLHVLIPQQQGVLAKLFDTPKEIQAPKNIILNVKLAVEHGPFAHVENSINNKKWLWGRGAAVGTVTIDQSNWSASLKKAAKNFVIVQQPFPVQVWGHWGGAITVDIAKKPGLFYVDKKEGLTVTHDGFVETLQLSRKFDKTKVAVSFNKILVKSGSGSVAISSIDAQSDMYQGLSGLWYGTQSLAVPLVSVVEAVQNLAQIQNIQLNVSNQLLGEQNITSRFGLDIGKFTVMGNELGPFKYHLSSHNIRPATFVALQNKLKQLNHQKWPSPPKNASTAQWQDFQLAQASKIFQALQPEIVSMLTGATLNLDTLQLQTPQGLVKTNLTVTFPDQINGTIDDSDALQNLALAANGSGRITFPVALADTLIELTKPYINSPPKEGEKAKPQIDTQQMIDQLVKQGYIHKLDGNYVMSLAYKGRAFTINGKGWMGLVSEEFNGSPKWRAVPTKTPKKVAPKAMPKTTNRSAA